MKTLVTMKNGRIGMFTDVQRMSRNTITSTTAAHAAPHQMPDVLPETIEKIA